VNVQCTDPSIVTHSDALAQYATMPASLISRVNIRGRFGMQNEAMQGHDVWVKAI